MLEQVAVRAEREARAKTRTAIAATSPRLKRLRPAVAWSFVSSALMRSSRAAFSAGCRLGPKRLNINMRFHVAAPGARKKDADNSKCARGIIPAHFAAIRLTLLNVQFLPVALTWIKFRRSIMRSGGSAGPFGFGVFSLQLYLASGRCLRDRLDRRCRLVRQSDRCEENFVRLRAQYESQLRQPFLQRRTPGDGT